MRLHSIEGVILLSQNYGKFMTAAPAINLYHLKICQWYLLSKVYCMQNFVWFHAIESEKKLSQKFWEKRNSSALYWAICTHIASLLFLMIHILHINFCTISSARNQDQGIPKISEKVKLQRQLLSDFQQNLIDINLCFYNTKY